MQLRPGVVLGGYPPHFPLLNCWAELFLGPGTSARMPDIEHIFMSEKYLNHVKEIEDI